MTPEALQRAADGLSLAAGDLAAAADRHGAVAQGAGVAAARIPDTWISPRSARLHTELEGVLGAVTPVPDALHASAGALEALGRTAGELAEELRRALAAAQSATAQAASASGRLRAVGDDEPMLARALERQVSERLAAARAADLDAAAVGARWDAVCRSCAALLESAGAAVSGALLGPGGAFDGDRSLLAASAGAAWRDASAMALVWGNGSVGGADARHTSLTDFVAGLGPGPFTPEEYRELAAEYVRGLLPEGREDDPYARNEAVTRAYAELYFLDPATYKWAGMAAFASDLVGDGIRQADAGRRSGLPWVPGLSDFSFTELSLALQGGNALVFADIYWQHLAYEHGGLEAIEGAFRVDEIDELAVAGWRSIDGGRRSGDQDAIWAGNRRLLRYEQEFTLQEGVYDHHRHTFRRLSSEVPGLVAPLTSPIPGDPVTFQDHHSWGDIGDFGDRWSWITESMLPAWREHEPSLQEDLWEFTR